ncbi:MAG: DUF2142 domain-containing protein, partial [Anaerolineae bacterium]|nr:DUF2142 domain-containing protein [Anaerolineae bacterium]
MKPDRLRVVRRHGPFGLLLIIFLILLRLYASTITPFEGPDELEHFAYITHLRETGRLPDPDTDADTLIGQEVAQPPLYYVLAALFSRLRPLDTWHGSPTPNPWWAYQGPNTGRDNRNHFMMASTTTNMQDVNQQHLAEALNWLRWLSHGCGLLAVTGVYLAGLALWPDGRRWALLAALGMALTPQLLQVFSIVSNDAAVIACGSLVIAGALRLRDRWYAPRLLALTGLLMGLAALSKVAGLALWPVPVLAVIMGWWSEPHRLPTRRLVLALALLIGIAALVGGWWTVRGWALYDDPFGFGPHEKQAWAWEAMGKAPSSQDVIERLPLIVKGLWADFGWGSVRPAAWGYTIPAGIALLGLVGWLRTRPDDRALLLVLAVLLGSIAMVRWIQVSNLVPGRLLFPFYGAFVLLIVWGLRAFEHARTWIAGLLGGVAVIMVPTVIYPAFGPPALLDDPPADLSGPVLDFGGPRFVGYTLDDPTVHTGGWRQITLCWQAPDGDQRVPVPYAYALHVVGPDNTRLAGRESYPGLGTYTLWEPGKAFCDTFDLKITGHLDAGRVYPLALSLFDVASGQTIPFTAADGAPQQVGFIGHVRSPAARVSADAL